ncbi:hypothetical protein [Lihuaxuella thermophila]|uniref:Uncharacterized protein n=1 Tax=Lihuaxuella thermophila TaxID=1173111 RepID=A0A1H8CE36_9BACL|nr:hypothetical protein [Lihuaxuella thermophila]SEM93295.1 hypothetical protein SAMN05444955_103239 [Lihuaxuella thermophila]
MGDSALGKQIAERSFIQGCDRPFYFFGAELALFSLIKFTYQWGRQIYFLKKPVKLESFAFWPEYGKIYTPKYPSFYAFLYLFQ